MSTRCQVEIMPNGNYGSPILLYHHTDGYPEYMLPIIRNAYERFVVEPMKLEGGNYIPDKAGISEHVASMIISSDPRTFEVEAPPPKVYNRERGNPLHSDIVYFYRVYPTQKDGKIQWEVEVYSFKHASPNYYTISDLEPIIRKGPIQKVSEPYWDIAIEKMWIPFPGGPGVRDFMEVGNLCKTCKANAKK
jgi:hypothetical protein